MQKIRKKTKKYLISKKQIKTCINNCFYVFTKIEELLNGEWRKGAHSRKNREKNWVLDLNFVQSAIEENV